MNEALFPSMACVQVVTACPISSNPVLQVYVAVSPTELPVNVTSSPLPGLLGLEHRAEKQTTKSLVIYGVIKSNCMHGYFNRMSMHLRRQIGCAGKNEALLPPVSSVQVVTA